MWCVCGLIVATFMVSSLGAAFSIMGIGALFSGAAIAVCAMAGSLELSKFVLAAYLHQRWSHIHKLMKTYLLVSVVVLSAITSMGIFGFLSNAYQSASAVLESETIKLDSLKVQQAHNLSEIARLNKMIEDIPINRVTKRLTARAEQEPAIHAYTKQNEQIEQQVTQANLRILEVKQKVGPLIYIARAFHMDLDSVVKYLILVFVSVFDPLAICMVVATSEAIASRSRSKDQKPVLTEQKPESKSHIHLVPMEETPGEHLAQVIQMRFADDDSPKRKVS